MWKPSSTEVLELSLPTECAVFRDKFDSLQESIAKISIMDELLAGEVLGVTYIQGKGKIDFLLPTA